MKFDVKYWMLGWVLGHLVSSCFIGFSLTGSLINLSVGLGLGLIVEHIIFLRSKK